MSNLDVLILGGTGIIGRDLCRESVVAGNRVTLVSRGHIKMPGSADLGVTVMTGDLYRDASLIAALRSKNFDVVVDLLSFNSDQLEKTLGIFAGRCKQYIFVSSATVYAPSQGGIGIPEAHDFTLDTWSYPINKIRAEARLRQVCGATGQVFTILRPYIIYSDRRVPFGTWEAKVTLERISAGRTVLIGEALAKSTTSLTHSNDLALATVLLFGNSMAANEDFHIASDEQVSWQRVHEVAADVVGVPLKLLFAPDAVIKHHFRELSGKIADRTAARIFDNSKFLAVCPQFKFRYSLSSGFADVIPKILSEKSFNGSAISQGRIDRLVGLVNNSTSVRLEQSSYQKLLRKKGTTNFLFYRIGRSVAAMKLLQYSVRVMIKVFPALKRSARLRFFGTN